MITIRVLDTETTGLPPSPAKVVEIAILDLIVDTDSLVVSRGRSWSSLVNPGIPIPPEASAVHHITDDMVKDAPPLSSVITSALCTDETTALPEYYAAHEARFDKEILKLEGVDLKDTPWLCSRKCSATWWPDAPNHKNQTMRYLLKLKLADESLAIPHRASGDVYVTGALVRRMIGMALSDGSRVTPELMAQISARPVLLPKLTFGKHAMQPCSEIPSGYWDWILNNVHDDEDVIHTAKTYLAARRSERRDRSPV